MKIVRFISGFIGTNCYLVNEGTTNILIDAEVGLDKLEKETKTLDAVFLTHAHFDHIKNLKKITDRYNCVVYVHENGVEKLTDPKKNYSSTLGVGLIIDTRGMIINTLQGGEILDVGEIRNIEVVSTPGHTICSLCFKIGENLFSGDTLFLDGVGRTDLGEGDLKSLETSLKIIGNLGYTNIYPGHGDTGKRISDNVDKRF